MPCHWPSMETLRTDFCLWHFISWYKVFINCSVTFNADIKNWLLSTRFYFLIQSAHKLFGMVEFTISVQYKLIQIYEILCILYSSSSNTHMLCLAKLLVATWLKIYEVVSKLKYCQILKVSFDKINCRKYNHCDILQ